MLHPISSTTNPRVKRAAALRQGRHRRDEGRFPIDGVRELRRALEAGIEVSEFFFCPGEFSPDHVDLLERCKATGAELLSVTPAVLERLAYGDRQTGFVAIARAPVRGLNQIALPELPLVAVLEGVEKPGNVGAICRSGDAAGISALLLAGIVSDIWNPNAIRASQGTLFSMSLAAAEGADTYAWLRAKGLKIFAARVNGGMDYRRANFNQPCAVVLGSEAEGLSDLWRGDAIESIALPVVGIADSLNVSATAAVLFYEAIRQRAAC